MRLLTSNEMQLNPKSQIVIVGYLWSGTQKILKKVNKLRSIISIRFAKPMKYLVILLNGLSMINMDGENLHVNYIRMLDLKVDINTVIIHRKYSISFLAQLMLWTKLWTEVSIIKKAYLRMHLVGYTTKIKYKDLNL